MPRRLLACVACVWLLWHVSVTAGVLVTQWPAGHSSSTTCECTHGPGAMCPMHKSPQGRLTCVLGVAAALDASALLSLLGPIGVPATAPSVFTATLISALNGHVPTRIDRALTPDAPPPRA